MVIIFKELRGPGRQDISGLTNTVNKMTVLTLFKREELDLLQRHETTTAEKSFMCHNNFTQGSHVVEVDIINNTVYVEPFMSRYMSVHQTT